MSIEALNWAKFQKCPTPSTKLVLIVLANYADQANSCFPSEAHIAKICEISPRQVRRCIVELEKLALVRTQNRSGTSNRNFLSGDTGVRGRGDTDVRGGVDTDDRGVVTPTSSYTKDIHNKEPRRKSLNEIAG